MTASLGDMALTASVLIAAGAFLAAISAGRFDSDRWMKLSRTLVVLFAIIVTLACAVLIDLLLKSDFRTTYVAGYTERALPWPYKLAAFWAGQEGSLLLWTWLIAIMSAVAVFQQRKNRLAQSAGTTATLAGVSLFFAALMLYAANPFAQSAQTPPDGHGLNPLLQDPAMIAHPPMLFVGYAGFTVPFAILVGALVARRKDTAYLLPLRKWVLVSWLFLSIGIVLGAQWAYIELGWGGYWAWDPVENASLLPWLTATALLHSIIVQQQRNTFKGWNAALIACTFLLCIFGTYLTRSGVIQSVHAFPESLVGKFFLAFLIVCVVASVVILFVRRDMLVGENKIESLLSKEGLFLATNALLVLMTAVTLVGTIFPLISGPFAHEPVSVGPPFYNHVVVPMAMILLAMMATGPLLVFGPGAAGKLGRMAVVPGLVALIALAVAIVLGLHDAWSLACVAIVTFAVCSIFVDLGRVVINKWRLEGPGLIGHVIMTLDANHRRYGGQLVHVGMLMVMVGIAGSSLFGQTHQLSLTPGQPVKVGRYEITLSKLEEIREGHFTAVQASVMLQPPSGDPIAMRPQVRFYDKSEQSNTEVALRWTLREDVYLTLAGWDANGTSAGIQAMVNPLVSWIWIGAGVLTLGALFGLLPRMFPEPRAAAGIALPITAPGNALPKCTSQ
ncbi:MAG: hypothetical protein GC164_03170 [Phycisphaera sp.]|nr:hypothetical protein [Phycisphaera sp.]